MTVAFLFMSIHTHNFTNCNISIDTADREGWHVEGLAVVTFTDGTFTTARPHTTEEYQGHALRAGYGTNVTAFTVEHELAHAFLAEALGLPYSQVQWDDAHGVQDRDVIVEEERYVRHFQRLANQGHANAEKIAVLIDAGLNLDELVWEWEALRVEVFGSLRWWE